MMLDKNTYAMTVNDKKATILFLEEVPPKYRYNLQLDFPLQEQFINVAVHKNIGGFARVVNFEQIAGVTRCQIETQAEITRHQQIMTMANIMNLSYV
jgi:hypothetical protein